MKTNRREFIALASGALAACAAPSRGQATQCLATASDIEGPFFKPGAPARQKLRGPGRKLLLKGRVTNESCKALSGVKLELWHADHEGDYDNRGFRFRTLLATDSKGRYSLQTIEPGRYLNGARYRPSHIHVKLHHPDYRSLTTQLYFPGDPYNEGDAFFKPALLMKTERRKGIDLALFNFVLTSRA